jgi:hypothetical protein
LAFLTFPSTANPPGKTDQISQFQSITIEKLMQTLQLVKYLFAQVLEEIRFLLLKPLIFICPGRERRLLRELRKNGFVVIKNFYKPSEIASINRDIEKTIRPLLSTSYAGVNAIPGSTRFRRPEKVSAFMKSLSRDIYWIALHALYNGYLSTPALMLSFTEKYSPNESSQLSENEIKFFASHPHFDSFKHEVKVVIALTNVDENSGPTEIAVGSSRYHFKYWQEYFSSWLAHRGMLESKTATISEDFYSQFKRHEKILLSPGDAAIFDSRNIHRATPLTEGKRDLLWFYF